MRPVIATGIILSEVSTSEIPKLIRFRAPPRPRKFTPERVGGGPGCLVPSSHKDIGCLHERRVLIKHTPGSVAK